MAVKAVGKSYFEGLGMVAHCGQVLAVAGEEDIQGCWEGLVDLTDMKHKVVHSLEARVEEGEEERTLAVVRAIVGVGVDERLKMFQQTLLEAVPIHVQVATFLVSVSASTAKTCFSW
jgi:hypothetical protein